MIPPLSHRMKVYAIRCDDYEGSSVGPFFVSRELAEEAFPSFATSSSDNGRWSIAEYDVLDHIPQKVTMFYVDHRGESGTAEWWDYELAELPRAGRFTVWGATEQEALANHRKRAEC